MSSKSIKSIITQYESRNKRKYQSYPERLLELINRRSLALHKAGSITHTLPEDEREHKRAYWEGYAEHVKRDLVAMVVAQHPDTRPVPPPTLDFEGKCMVIQRHDGVNTWYVEESKFDPTLYEYKRTDYTEHIRREISRH